MDVVRFNVAVALRALPTFGHFAVEGHMKSKGFSSLLLCIAAFLHSEPALGLVVVD
jgi:hypothetical protein